MAFLYFCTALLTFSSKNIVFKIYLFSKKVRKLKSKPKINLV